MVDTCISRELNMEISFMVVLHNNIMRFGSFFYWLWMIADRKDRLGVVVARVPKVMAAAPRHFVPATIIWEWAMGELFKMCVSIVVLHHQDL